MARFARRGWRVGEIVKGEGGTEWLLGFCWGRWRDVMWTEGGGRIRFGTAIIEDVETWGFTADG